MELVKNYEKIAIRYLDRSISYRELIEAAYSYGEVYDIEVEDKVLIYMENRPEFIYSFLGVWNKRGTCVCLDATFTAKELEYYLIKSDAKYMYTSRENLEKARAAIAATDVDIKVVVVEDIKIGSYKGELSLTRPEPEDISLMLYTSGTTGNPKAVMLTMDNMLANMEGLEQYNVYTRDDTVLAILPLHHIFPLLGSTIVPLTVGGTVVFLGELSKKAIGDCLSNNNITMILGVPRVYEMFHRGIMEKINSSKLATGLFSLAEKMENINFSRKVFKKVHEGFGGHIKCFISGGSKLDPQISKDFLTLGIKVIEGYGMTETAPMISFTPIETIRPGSAGIVLPGTEVRIAEDGEIQSRGRHIMKGYYKNPEATSEMIDKDGWIHTGDLGSIEDGFLYITGRKKEMIVLSNGKNINPVEIEAKLMKMSKLIQEVAITEYEGLLTAVIYPNVQEMREAAIVNVADILKRSVIDEYNLDAPNYKKILDVKVVSSELPKTKLGKFRRFMLKEFLDGYKSEEVVVEEPKYLEYSMLSKYLEGIKGKKISPEAHLELNLGLDSLEFVELTSYLDHTFGITIDEEIFANNFTVKTLAEYIRDNRGDINEEDTNWLDILSSKDRTPLKTPLISGNITNFFLHPLLKYFVKLSVKKVDYTRSKKPIIMVGNHQSFLDGFLLNSILDSETRKKTYYLAINIHFEGRIKRFAAEHGNIILVDQSKNIKDSLKMAANILQRGGNVVIFPEGARTRDGNIGKFKKSFAILAKELNIPVVAFGIKGAFDLMPYGSKMPKKGPVLIEFFKPCEVGDKKPREFTEETQTKLEEWLN